VSTVLWGGRRGDVQFGSLDDWRRNVPIGCPTIVVDSPRYFDVGNLLEGRSRPDRDVVMRVVGIRGDELGVREVTRMELVDGAGRPPAQRE
jgi:hypothetical protein